MNTELLNKVADAIEATLTQSQPIERLGFSMRLFVDGRNWQADKSGHRCNTTACIAGWGLALHLGMARAAQVKAAFVDSAIKLDGFEEKARDVLGLTDQQALALFYGAHAGRLTAITVPQAVATIRHLAKTGVVDWSIQERQNHG